MIRLAFAQGFAQVGFHAWIATLPVALSMAGRPDGEIGAIVGAAAVFNLITALFSGGLVDRFGGRVIYLVGTACYLGAAAPVALGLIDAESPFGLLIVMRFLQGCGLSAVMPSVMTLLPGTVSRQRLPMAVGVVGIAGNISLALTPALMLWVMELAGLPAVGLAVCVVVSIGALLIWPVRDAQRAERRIVTGRLMMRTVWKPEWFRPLLVTTLIIVNWGVITGYLPQRAEAAGADVGLFFTMDALALTALRIPTGWLAGRIGPVPMLLAGCLITAASISLLLLPASTLVLAVSGLGTGAGSALVFPVLNLEINERSEPANRGSAFGLYSVAFGAGVAIGSLGLAPFYAVIGWEIALGIGVAAAVAAGVVAVLDPLMHHPPIGRVPADPPTAGGVGAERATAEG